MDSDPPASAAFAPGGPYAPGETTPSQRHSLVAELASVVVEIDPAAVHRCVVAYLANQPRDWACFSDYAQRRNPEQEIGRLVLELCGMWVDDHLRLMDPAADLVNWPPPAPSDEAPASDTKPVIEVYGHVYASQGPLSSRRPPPDSVEPRFPLARIDFVDLANRSWLLLVRAIQRPRSEWDPEPPALFARDDYEPLLSGIKDLLSRIGDAAPSGQGGSTSTAEHAATTSEVPRPKRRRAIDPNHDRWPYIVAKVAEYKPLRAQLGQEAAARHVKDPLGKPIPRKTLEGWLGKVKQHVGKA